MKYFYPAVNGNPIGKTIFTSPETAGAVAAHLSCQIDSCDGVPEWSDNTETRDVCGRLPGPGYIATGEWARIITVVTRETAA